MHNVRCLLPELPVSLEAWGSTGCTYSRPNPFVEEQYYHLSNLRVLDMSRCIGCFYPDQFLPPNRISKLTHLNCTGTTPSMLAPLPDHLLPNLRVLRISREIVDSGSLPRISQLSQLEEFHLSFSDISSSAMAEFIRMASSSLQYIQCNDCPNITADIIRLAESKGITLVVRNADSRFPSQQGRRLQSFDH